MAHKKQKKKGHGKQYPNRMIQHTRKKKKNGRIPLRSPMPYYLATKRLSYLAPIQPSLPPNMTPALEPTPLAFPIPAPPALQLLPSPSPTTTSTISTLASSYTSTSTLVSDYTYTSTTVFTPSSLPTPTQEIVENTPINLSSDEDTMPEDSSQLNESQKDEDTEDTDFSQVIITVDENNSNTPTVSAAAAIARGSNNIQNGTLATPNQIMQTAGPIVGIVGAMVIVAAAMFFVVRRRRSVSHKKKDESHDFEMPEDPSPTIPPSIVPTKEEKEMEENRFSHGTGTLVGSSRSNSTIKEKQKHMSISSWYSASSSMLEMPSLPSSEVMLAERQQLHHERPSLLNHWQKPTLIETYRAQLTDLTDITDTI